MSIFAPPLTGATENPVLTFKQHQEVGVPF
jgi:hypothetical protein